jgi:hemolysin activation/secretion protein
VDRFPLRPYIGYENSGNETTELDRYIAGFNWGDAFGLGLDQQLNYQFATSGDGTSLRAHSGSYLIPLPWRHTLSFFGSYVDTEGRVPPVVDLNGRSYQISGRYTIPLPTHRSPKLSLFHTVGFGFDFKYNENALEFNALQVGQTLYDIDQFVLTYNATQNDELGRTTLNNTFNYSPGNLSSNNEDADFASARALAESQYVYNNLVLERLTRLPADFSLIVRLTLQNSDGNLVPSEQLGFGGYNTIRGYEEREVNTDEGYIITTELRSPTFSLSEITGLKLGVSDQFQILAFWDYGSASNHTPLRGEVDSIELSSIGAGLRFSLGTYASVRFDYGFQLTRSSIDLQYGSRANIGVVVSY